jgi:hypothetical protein
MTLNPLAGNLHSQIVFCAEGLLQTADVAVLVVHRMPDICGTSSEIGGMNTRPLVIVEDSAVCLDQWTLDHEIGHLLGARHNPETGKREPKKYGYGKLLQPAGEGVVGFSTIMVSAKSIQYYSLLFISMDCIFRPKWPNISAAE